MSNDPFENYLNDPENDSAFSESKDRSDLVQRAKNFYDQIGLGSMQMLLYADLIAECIQIGSEIIVTEFKSKNIDPEEIRNIARSFEIEGLNELSDLDIIERMMDPMRISQKKFNSADSEFLADIFQEMKRRDLLSDFWNRFNGGVAPEI